MRSTFIYVSLYFMLVIKEEGYLDKNHQYELPEVSLSVANMKPCVADSVFTLTGAVWAALILFTTTFRVCPFCYSVNTSCSGKHLEANQPHQRRAIAHNETFFGLFPLLEERLVPYGLECCLAAGSPLQLRSWLWRSCLWDVSYGVPRKNYLI